MQNIFSSCNRISELCPSGVLVRKDPKNPMKCICTILMNGDPAQANPKYNLEMLDAPPLTNVSYLLSVASNLKSYSTIPKDHFGRYTFHIAERTCKEMADLFVDWPQLDSKANWKKVIKQPNIAVWAKQLPDRDILCHTGLNFFHTLFLFTGIFELNMRPREVFDILMEGVTNFHFLIKIGGGSISNI